ncbi:glycerate kinase [Ferrimonas sediminicola]|uniref:Glycerate kinase n=1 Tax=Ferrimonas sediminicola TaxID=2569538 RepID=A0A4U1BF19_9GAMM|nr:glycerate kinase [Ferrimonas sediminicola]TKB49697.1 glycerate kinase [Ferrimonas sediminicola]
MNVATTQDSHLKVSLNEEVKDAIDQRRPPLSLCTEQKHSPLAEVAEGGILALVAATGGRYQGCTVAGPLGRPRQARFGLLGDGTTAVIDTDEANGVRLLGSDPRRPMETTSRGSGELILAALDAGASRIIIGLGASAAIDGGLGLAQALGARLDNIFGEAAAQGGAGLAGLTSIEPAGLDGRLAEVTLEVACLNLNPLCGPRGAARLYGFQRGACEETMLQLDAHLSHFADLIRHRTGVEVKAEPGTGAGGGQGALLYGLLGATLRPLSDVMATELPGAGALCGRRAPVRLALAR